MYSFRAAHLLLLVGSPLIYAANPRTFLRKALDLDSDGSIQSLADRLPPGVTKDLFQSFSICGTCKTWQRFGEEHDGGYLACMDALQPSTLQAAYSMGVEHHDQWSLDVFQTFNVPVFQYDCTVSTPAQLCDHCHFFEACLTREGVNPFPGHTSWTLKEAIEHSNMSDVPDRSLLMKMDIENGEWPTLAGSDITTLKKFRQMIVEFHGIRDEAQHGSYLEVMQKLRQAGFKVVHVHGNNYGSVYIKEEFRIPEVVEVTFDALLPSLPACHDPTHEELDRPNGLGSPEIEGMHTEP